MLVTCLCGLACQDKTIINLHVIISNTLVIFCCYIFETHMFSRTNLNVSFFKRNAWALILIIHREIRALPEKVMKTYGLIGRNYLVDC